MTHVEDFFLAFLPLLCILLIVLVFLVLLRRIAGNIESPEEESDSGFVEVVIEKQRGLTDFCAERTNEFRQRYQRATGFCAEDKYGTG